MTADKLEQLRRRIMIGERPTEELWSLLKRERESGVDQNKAESLSDVWNLAFHFDGLFPKLEAAKALVETALASNTSYPILTNDGLIYDALSPTERHELVHFIRRQMDGAEAPVAKRALEEFIVDLLGSGPQF